MRATSKLRLPGHRRWSSVRTTWSRASRPSARHRPTTAGAPRLQYPTWFKVLYPKRSEQNHKFRYFSRTRLIKQCSDVGGVQHNADAVAHGLGGQVGGELCADDARVTGRSRKNDENFYFKMLVKKNRPKLQVFRQIQNFLGSKWGRKPVQEEWLTEWSCPRRQWCGWPLHRECVTCSASCKRSTH